MSNFEKVLTTLDAADTDINDTHKASTATEKRMETLNKRFTDEEKALKEANKLTQTAENVLKVEVVLNAANLSTLKTQWGDDLFKEFLRNIAHKNEKNRATALRQMEQTLSLPELPVGSLNLSMSDKHSEQLIRTEILDHIAQQLLGGSNLTIAANYIYGSDEALDAKLDDMSEQVIAMLEGFKESDSLKDVDPRTASYNAMFKASDQRYFDDALGNNKLRSESGEVMRNFAEKMAKDGLSVVTYRDLANQFLADGMDLNAKELVILTGNGMLPFEARTRSQFKFQYLTYLPELGGYAGVMANGCGDAGKEGNFVFIKDEQSETSKKLTRDGFITEDQRKLNEEKKKIEELRALGKTDEEINKIIEKEKEALKLKEDEAKKVKEDEEKKFKDELKNLGKTEEESNKIIEKAKEKGLDLGKITDQQKEDLIKEVEQEAKKLEEEKKAKEEEDNFNKIMEAEAEKAKVIEDKKWREDVVATGTLHKDGSPTRGVLKLLPKSPDLPNVAGKTVHILMQNPSNPGTPGVSKEFTVRPDGTVELPNDVYIQQKEGDMVDIVVSNEPFTVGAESGFPEGSKEVNLVPAIDNDVPVTDNNTDEELKPGDNDALAGSEAAGSDREPKLRRMFKLSPFEKKALKDFGLEEKVLEDYIVQQARDTETNKGPNAAWEYVRFAIKDIRERIITANKIMFLDYRIKGEPFFQKRLKRQVDGGDLFQDQADALGFLASSPTLETGSKITLTKDIIVNGIKFPRVTFESSYNQNDLKVTNEVIEASDGNKYRAVVANGIVSFLKQGEKKEEVTE